MAEREGQLRVNRSLNARLWRWGLAGEAINIQSWFYFYILMSLVTTHHAVSHQPNSLVTDCQSEAAESPPDSTVPQLISTMSTTCHHIMARTSQVPNLWNPC